MKRKLTAMILALVMAVSLLPMPAAAATVCDEEQIKAVIAEIVTEHAAKVYQPNADDAAFDLFFKHGFYGNGKDLILDDSSPMVAALFNSCLMQEALINGITKSIMRMDTYRLDEVQVYSDVGWHNYYYNYGFSGFLRSLESKRNYDYFLGSFVSTGTSRYTGPTNENDSVMELLAGALYSNLFLSRRDLGNGMMEYTIDIHIKDDFDFNGSYTDISDKGYNTSKDDALKDLGLLMTFMGLDEFYWEYKLTRTITLPYSCDHGLQNYHFTYDGAATTVSSDGGSGYTLNPTTRKEYVSTNATTNEKTVKVYHMLDDYVVLLHDQPWVMEWDQKVLRTLQFSAVETTSVAKLPTVYSSGSYYVWLYFTEYVQLPDGQKTETGATYYNINHYLGVYTRDKFEYSYKYTYTHKLENVVNPDGSNTIYLTIYNNDLGETVLGPEPMDDHWTKRSNETERTLISTESDKLSGMDIVIGSIGNKNVGLGVPEAVLDLRIWEGGKDYTAPDGTYVAPTCTEPGGMRHYCPDCEEYYFTDVEAALGHSFTEYVENGNATCVENGTKSRKCTVCGEIETVVIEDTALGHDFGEYISDGNVTCTADGTETRTCARCGVTETRVVEGSALGHDFGNYSYDHNATCLEDGTKTATCANCGATDVVTAEGSALGHNHKPTVTEPTCTEQGYTTYTCHCGDTYVDDYTDIIPHSEVIDPAVKSTCVTNGKTEGKHCEVCGLVTVKQKNLATSDHTWDEGVPSEQAGLALYTCIHCGATMESIATEPTPGFSDVPSDAWYAAAVNWAKKQGITSGLTETLFGSDYPCTRGQVVTFLWAAAGKPAPTSTENPFNDVSESDYYYTPVLWAVEKGITGGVGEGMFGPDQSCTRGQIVTFLWRAVGSPETTGESNFTDVSASDYFAAPVQWAAENQVTGGIGDGMFGPNQTCTRAQVVTFLYKVYG